VVETFQRNGSATTFGFGGPGGEPLFELSTDDEVAAAATFVPPRSAFFVYVAIRLPTPPPHDVVFRTDNGRIVDESAQIGQLVFASTDCGADPPALVTISLPDRDLTAEVMVVGAQIH
jgi:hypothetical protein